MDAVIFDIDGTLLKSNSIDGELYVRAIRNVLGAIRIRDSWSAYTHVTDDGILEELLLDNEIEPSQVITRQVQTVFFDSLLSHITLNGALPEIPGAKSFIETLQQSGVAVAYATGGWRESAMMKLQSAGLPLAGIPLATSDDSKIRVEIMRTALQRLGSGIEKITYYGDGEWDRIATQELEWKFEPVGKSLGGITDYFS